MDTAGIPEIERAARGVLDPEGAELVDTEYRRENGRWVLRFFLDKAGGVTLDDCEYFSNRLGAALDAGNLIPHSYALEVSSPGVDRKLKTEKDFRRFSGHRIKLRLKSPAENGQRHFSGVLRASEDGRLLLEQGSGDGLSFSIPEIEEARLHPEIEI